MNSLEALVATFEGHAHVLVLGTQLLDRLPPKRRVEEFSMQLRSAKKRRS
jgi:hypothetical protein